MNQQCKIATAAVSVLLGVIGVSSAFAQSGTIASLDVIVRDFEPGHSDFENFSEEYAGYED